MTKQTLRDFVEHPATLATALTGVFGGLLHVPVLKALWLALWGSLGSLFPALSITAFTLGPELPWLPTGLLKTLALIVGGLFVLKLLVKAYDNFATKL